MTIASINPSTGETIETFPELTSSELEHKLALAARVFREHRASPLQHRAALLNAAANILDSDKPRLARIITEEMGKPIRDASAEVEKCARTCRHYASHGREYLADQRLPSEGSESFVRHLPLGPVLAVMPWNFPFWQVVRFAAPALMAGNVGLLKHASNVPRCALALQDVFQRAGFPDGVFQTLLVGTEQVRGIIKDPRVVAVTVTGSEGAGAQVAAAAGGVWKKVVLELGGSDPFIVMPSADLAAAARIGATARNLNSGQSCIAAKRFIVHRDVYAQFERLFVDEVRALKVGDPLHGDTNLGPLATARVRDDIERQVAQTLAAGARLLLGGARQQGRGFFYQATVLADVPPGSPAVAQELFGPVAPLLVARDLDHAIQLANDTPYGLGSSAWTTDPTEERRFIDEIEAGQTFINAMVASDPRLPFGGIKRSGYGRELSAVGMHEFMNAKTVFVNRSSSHHKATTE